MTANIKSWLVRLKALQSQLFPGALMALWYVPFTCLEVYLLSELQEIYPWIIVAVSEGHIHYFFLTVHKRFVLCVHSSCAGTKKEILRKKHCVRLKEPWKENHCINRKHALAPRLQLCEVFSLLSHQNKLQVFFFQDKCRQLLLLLWRRLLCGWWWHTS